MVQTFRRDQNRAPTQTFRLRALARTALYDVIDLDLDGGSPAKMTGKDLMDRGLTVEIEAKPGAAVILCRKTK